jgi:hypothetical protein
VTCFARKLLAGRYSAYLADVLHAGTTTNTGLEETAVITWQGDQ